MSNSTALDLDWFIDTLGLQSRPLDKLHPVPAEDVDSLATLELTRRRAAHASELPPSIPTDVFVWALGESPNPWLTKIGGLPYRPKQSPWPIDVNGRPRVFLAQFYFGESRDVVGELPGDVLLVFSTDPYQDLDPGSDQTELYLEWQTLDINSDGCVTQHPNVSCRCVCCYGVRHRTVDYLSPFPPNSLIGAIAEHPEESSWQMGWNERSRQEWSYYLTRIIATKIGGLPVEPVNSDPAQIHPPNGAVFLATLTRSRPACDNPYPWVNHREPISWDESLREQRELVFGPWFVAINFYLTVDGRVFWQFLKPVD